MLMGRLNCKMLDVEGSIGLSKEFKMADPTVQIDLLGDWIYELEQIQKALLDQEHPVVRAQLYGK
jgi:hypothetical protein